MIRSALLLILVAACADPVTTRTLTDEGGACVEGDAITVDFWTCTSSSCDTLISATCTAALEAGDVVVHGEAVIESQGDECTDDCGFVTATCALPDIADPAGVEVVYGGERVALEEGACTDER